LTVGGGEKKLLGLVTGKKFERGGVEDVRRKRKALALAREKNLECKRKLARKKKKGEETGYSPSPLTRGGGKERFQEGVLSKKPATLPEKGRPKSFNAEKKRKIPFPSIQKKKKKKKKKKKRLVRREGKQGLEVSFREGDRSRGWGPVSGKKKNCDDLGADVHRIRGGDGVPLLPPKKGGKRDSPSQELHTRSP